MNTIIKVGKIVNTHGIKGELKILSSGNYSLNEFSNFPLVIIKNKEFTVTSYRKHKNFHMIKLAGFKNINQVLQFKNTEIFTKEEYLTSVNLELLIGKQVFLKKEILGYVKTISKTKHYDLLVLGNGQLIPYTKHFIITEDKNKIEVGNLDEI